MQMFWLKVAPQPINNNTINIIQNNISDYMSQTTETQWAYVAGIFDGEGYLGIFKHTSPSFRANTKQGFVVEYRINISNNSKDLLLKIKELTGGYGTIYTHKRTNPNHATGYRLSFYPNAGRLILPKIIPYLILKRETAEIMLKMLQVKKTIHQLEHRKIMMWELTKEFDKAFSKVCRTNKPNTVFNNENQQFWSQKRELLK